ncbi:MAG: ABC transporter ATP-binding protein [Armatimonadota bacterium]|nr:ABC transporter ATP-binding protein [Armatimonadota bacterium]MDR7451888.1 ABC transporter ATP-binding protein [Armatimonadota bacterium]MDR7467613.1 ABC transporter ATP-binding protein [Armatimonadota bacterium]MDR7494426.1 ABC transporter ATP-binding protein [Armatimonadota bacterium]MDR7500406.1 ABC transporter ATP-binding protein [Armatimonadota bacterium]
MSDAIRLRGLHKSFGALPVLRGFDLTVRRGTILSLLGPSGCGKTTVLRLVAGLEVPDAGTVEIDGQVVSGPGVMVPPERRRIGMVFQEYALFPHLNVGQNVAYGLPGRSADPGRVAALLDLVGLAGLQDRMAYELSGGQQQRVALARALARDPLVVLLDEPFSNLDADLRQQLREEMREILLRTRTTAVFVTHDQEEALQIGDEVAVMHRGVVEQVGTPEAVYQQPRTRFIANFLGRADFLPATVTAQGLRTEVGLIPQRPPLAEGTAVDLLVRADDVAIAPGEGGVVVSRMFRGMQHLYRVRLPSGRILHSLQDHTVHYPPGATVRVAIDPGHPLVCFPNGEAVLADVVPAVDPPR